MIELVIAITIITTIITSATGAAPCHYGCPNPVQYNVCAYSDNAGHSSGWTSGSYYPVSSYSYWNGLTFTGQTMILNE